MPDTLYLHNGTVVNNHRKEEQECATLFNQLTAQYSWFDTQFHVAAADQYQHEVLNIPVIRTCFRSTDASTMLGQECATAHRLFRVGTNESFLYVTQIFLDEQPSWKPDGSWVLGRTNHFEEAGRPAPTGFDSFNEYFMVCSPAVIESLGLSTVSINDDTLISFLVSTDGTVLAKRRYTNYVEGDGILANFVGAYVWNCRRERRMDLARELFATGLV